MKFLIIANEKAPKPSISLAGQQCPTCKLLNQKGKFELTQICEKEVLCAGRHIIFPEIWVEKCNNCWYTVYPCKTIRFMEQAISSLIHSFKE